MLLWISPNEKQSFARKASCGAVRLTAKLVKYLLLINSSQKLYFSNLAVYTPHASNSCGRRFRVSNNIMNLK